jgi:hypothetical protein
MVNSRKKKILDPDPGIKFKVKSTEEEPTA